MTLELITSAVNGIIGKPAWNVKRGHQSFLTLEFGDRRTTAWGAVHGQWHLWVHSCAWRIEAQGQMMISSEDDDTVIDEMVPMLNGRKLETINVTPPIFDTVFSFEGNLVLRTFAVLPQRYECWQLFIPDNKVLTVRLGQGSVQHSDEPPRYEEGDHVNG